MPSGNQGEHGFIMRISDLGERCNPALGALVFRGLGTPSRRALVRVWSLR